MMQLICLIFSWLFLDTFFCGTRISFDYIYLLTRANRILDAEVLSVQEESTEASGSGVRSPGSTLRWGVSSW